MYLKELKIGNVKLENNIILAPMAGVTDLPFRIVCKKYGNPGLVCNEMVSAKAIVYEDEKTLEMIKTNIVAVHALTKLFLKDMVKKDKGYILNVSSIAGFLPGPLMGTYYSTKAYVLRLTQSLQEEFRKQKLKVTLSVLCPGPTATDFLSRAGVSFKTKSASSEYVARYAIDKLLKGKKVILPTFKIKCARFLCKIVPDRILSKVAYKIQKKRDK